MQPAVQQFLSKFLQNVPKTPSEKIKHWLFVANNTVSVCPDADAQELKRRRRNARNNVRRLIKKHVNLLPALTAELERQ